MRRVLKPGRRVHRYQPSRPAKVREGKTMRILTLRRHHTSMPGRGITSLADVPIDPHIKVLHLCRYPEKCCTV